MPTAHPEALKIPILTYHSMAIEGNDYGNNDHVALAADVERILATGFRIRPLHEIVAKWIAAPHELDGQKIVALTCDDGGDFDYADLPHPVAGIQRSFINIMKDHRTAPGSDASPHITSFVIVSPEARQTLDVRCMVGKRWWNDHWWKPAVDSGLMGIANHSWDHNHDCLADDVFPGVQRGTFRTIDTEALADYQIERASAYLRKIAPGPSTALFAYPYGESNEYLVREYFPRHATRVGVVAAFDDQATPMTHQSDRWELPRYVFRRDWKAPSDLEAILQDAARSVVV